MTISTEQTIKQVREQGYALLPQLFSKQQVADTLLLVEQQAVLNQQRPIKDLPRLDSGQETIYNLQNKDYRFLELLLKSPEIEQVLKAFLNDEWHKAIDLSRPNYILRSYSARNNQVAAPLHIDSFIPYQGGHAISMQVAIVLQDQHKENGCTILIPQSHQSGKYVSPEDADKAVAIESSAGDVVFWDSRIWHGTLPNQTSNTRWSLIATFVRWWIKQGYQITENLPQSIYDQLNDNEKAVLGYCARPFADESEGIDFKTGYDRLKPRVSDY
jgi:ectoine hydroxylase-related dioxygenase (phytanoyl-CoA dioxygenase family)